MEVGVIGPAISLVYRFVFYTIDKFFDIIMKRDDFSFTINNFSSRSAHRDHQD